MAALFLFTVLAFLLVSTVGFCLVSRRIYPPRSRTNWSLVIQALSMLACGTFFHLWKTAGWQNGVTVFFILCFALGSGSGLATIMYSRQTFRGF